MPCYQVIVTKVVFKVENLDILEKALKEEGWLISKRNQDSLTIQTKNYTKIEIDLKNGTMTSSSFRNEKELIDTSNAIKRAYSLQVINQVAQKQKWIQKKMGYNHYQLQRF